MKGIKHIFSSFLTGNMQLIVIFVATCSLSAQGFDISGRVFKEDGKSKLGPVRIVLYDQNKKKIVELEQPGKFKIKNIACGKYTANFYGPDGYGKTENFEIKTMKLPPIFLTLL